MNKVQCIVVGAGPAGSACAYSLARKGIETVLVERGRVPGEKNIASFVLIPAVLKHLIPDYRDSAPLERTVTEFPVLQLGRNDFFKVQGRFYGWQEKPLVFTAFRSRFDAWFAGKAEEAGAHLAAGMTVTGLIIDGGKVIGIRVGEEELYADVVVGADGAHSLLAEKAGLVSPLDTRQTHLAVKEVLDLPAGAIEERFQLGSGEGCCIHGMGCYPVDDIGGFYTMYTNKDSIGLAAMGTVSLLAEKGAKMQERLAMLKDHPYIRALIKGSTTREYQAHLLSYGGRVEMKNVYSHGFLLCGEAGGFVDSFKIGVPTGMLTGMMAAETIELAVKKKDFSAKTLKRYRDYLRSTPLPDIVSKTKKYNAYYVKKGIGRIPGYSRTVAKVFEEIPKDRFDYISKERYSFVNLVYEGIIIDFIPRYVRWASYPFAKAITLMIVIMKKIKTGRSVYEWKKPD